eukprot:scaffold3297_cov60-Phaeocystis_antarctica.AAC.4
MPKLRLLLPIPGRGRVRPCLGLPCPEVLVEAHRLIQRRPSARLHRVLLSATQVHAAHTQGDRAEADEDDRPYWEAKSPCRVRGNLLHHMQRIAHNGKQREAGCLKEIPPLTSSWRHLGRRAASMSRC